MQRYMYKHGDHPLEGYTIQRAAGRGGFGEVYYALSDSGREVALKAVQNYEQIELRGITQCMNLKSPHLVTIFDVKYNDRGQPFVIMEYVSGPSLRTLITESPGGIGKQKAAFFLREIAKGLSYLHECGIVHRDLKPGNIFYENGYVKICDYGLTKAVSASRHSGHTITVGTVHYMAPEIGAGKYNFGIDIYALGILLYEMLTGDVPFAGESPAEILMKHMSSEPEMKNIDEPFARVIKRALAKDPDERYQTIQEMVEDLFGEENIRNSVSQFAPEELSMIAQRVAAKAKFDDTAKEQAYKTPSPENKNSKDNEKFTQNAKGFYDKVDRIGKDVAYKVDAKVDTILGAKQTKIPGVTDPILPAQRYMLAFVSMGIISLGAGFLHGGGTDKIGIAFGTFILMNVCVSTILSQRYWLENLGSNLKWLERLITPFIVAFIAQFIAGIFKYHGSGHIFVPMFLSTALIDWRRISLIGREKRLSLGSALWAGLLGAIFGSVFGSEPILIAGILAGTSLGVQAISSYSEDKKNKVHDKTKSHNKRYQSEFHSSTSAGVVPNSLRLFWFMASIISLGVGLFFVISGGTQHNNYKFAHLVGIGVDGLILSIFFFIGSLRSSFNGWFRYLVKPAIMLACVLTIIYTSIYMGCVNLYGDDFNIALFMIIFPSILLLFTIAFPASLIAGNTPLPANKKIPQAAPGVSGFKRFWALLFTAGTFLGFNGIQRFYVGKFGTGILWFFTFGLCGIGQIIDVILILSGSFKDRFGLPLIMWFDKDEINHKATVSKAPVNEYKKPVPEYKEPVNEYKEPVREEPEVQAKVVKEYTSSPSFTSSITQGQFHPFTFLISGIGYILILLGLLVSISTGLRIPSFVSISAPELSNDLQDAFNTPRWPEYITGLGPAVAFILVMIATVLIIISRRHSGLFHLIRAVLGMVGVFLSLLWFSAPLAPSSYYGNRFDNFIKSNQTTEAFNEMLGRVYDEDFVLTAFIFLISIVILAWPARRKQTILTDTQSHGVN